MRREQDARTGVATARTSVRIFGEAQILMFEVMCAVEGRRPHQLAGDIILAAVKAAQEDPQLRDAAENMRRSRHRRRTGLRLIPGEEQP